MPSETAAQSAQAPASSPKQEQATAVQPRVAPAAAKAAKADKGKKDKKAKGKAEGAAADSDGPTIAAHPRAARAVRRIKGWAGLLGFLLAGYASLATDTVAGAMLRALVAGIVCYVVAWAGAVFVWRRLVILEVRNREAQLLGPPRGPGPRRELPPAPRRRGAGG